MTGGTSLVHDPVLLKLSGEGFGGGPDGSFDPGRLEALVEELSLVRKTGARIGVVVGAGNLVRGASLEHLGLDRAAADRMGMLATVVNGTLLVELLRAAGVPAVHLVAAGIAGGEAAATAPAARAALARGEVVVYSGGTGNPFFTTDTAGAVRALEIGARVLVKATKVDGVYDRDPVTHPDATRLATLSHAEVLRRELGVMDLTAVALCQHHGLPIIVCDLFVHGNLERLVRGEQVGTRIG